eukprot:GHVT01051106.1.p1 GENE.GHVT01051106.1~~GHVT01051106.1.p1  ORF type:complete len:442 (-),score=76.43 GHVT01051106.1:369-1601(-)
MSDHTTSSPTSASASSTSPSPCSISGRAEFAQRQAASGPEPTNLDLKLLAPPPKRKSPVASPLAPPPKRKSPVASPLAPPPKRKSPVASPRPLDALPPLSVLFLLGVSGMFLVRPRHMSSMRGCDRYPSASILQRPDHVQANNPPPALALLRASPPVLKVGSSLPTFDAGKDSTPVVLGGGPAAEQSSNSPERLALKWRQCLDFLWGGARKSPKAFLAGRLGRQLAIVSLEAVKKACGSFFNYYRDQIVEDHCNDEKCYREEHSDLWDTWTECPSNVSSCADKDHMQCIGSDLTSTYYNGTQACLYFFESYIHYRVHQMCTFFVNLNSSSTTESSTHGDVTPGEVFQTTSNVQPEVALLLTFSAILLISIALGGYIAFKKRAFHRCGDCLSDVEQANPGEGENISLQTVQ